MTRKADIDSTNRDIHFNPAGNDEFSGTNVENAVCSPTRAIERVNELDPVPSGFDPASINASETGLFTVGIVTPDFTTINCEDASIITADAINVDIGNFQTVKWGSLVNNGDDGVNCMIDGKFRVALVVTSLIAGSDGAFSPETFDNIGVQISGNCEAIFVDVKQLTLFGERAVGIEHTAESGTPINYQLTSAEFFNEDQTLLRMDSSPGTQIEFNIGTMRMSNFATNPTTNSHIFDIISGTASVIANSLVANTLARVKVGGLLTLKVNGAVGDIILETGARCTFESGSLLGDIVVESSARLTVILQNHIGTITNNGTINGIINGKRYGTWIVAAEDVTYDNTDSGLIADNVKEAIDELATPEVGIMFMTGNTVPTVITTQNTYVDIEGPIGAAANNELFDFDGDDTLIYTGERPLTAAFDVSFFTKRESAAASRVMKAALLINDVVEQEVEFTMSAGIANASFVSVAPLVTDDEIKMQVQNTADTANIIFTTFDFRILRA